MVLPANTEVCRTVTGESIHVRVVSRPYFGDKSADWPMLSAGPVVVTFLRDEQGGGVLMLGDELVPRRVVIALSADGRSLHKLDMTLGLDRLRGQATLAVSGAAPVSLDVVWPTGQIEVSLSAGGSQTWLLEQVEVRVMASVSESVGAARNVSVSAAMTDSPRVEAFVDPPDTQARLTQAWSKTWQQNAIRRQMKAQVLGRLSSGEAGTMEPLLKGGIDRPLNSPAWHIEAACLLRAVAQELSGQGKFVAAQAAAEQALLEVARAIEMPKISPSLEALAWRLTGEIQLEFLGDLPSAQASYAQALQKIPTDSKARSAFTRIESIQKTIGANGGGE